MICPDCNGDLVKMLVENEDSDWVVVYSCDCDQFIDENLTPEDQAELIGAEMVVHSSRGAWVKGVKT